MVRSGISVHKLSSLTEIDEMLDSREQKQKQQLHAAASNQPFYELKPLRRREWFSSPGYDDEDRGSWLRGMDEAEEAAMVRHPVPMSPERQAPALPAELLMPEIGKKAQVVLDTTPTMSYVKLSMEHKTDRLNYIKFDRMERIRYQNALPSAVGGDKRKSQAESNGSGGGGGGGGGAAARTSMPTLPEPKMLPRRESSAYAAVMRPPSKACLSGGGFLVRRTSCPGNDTRTSNSLDGSSWQDHPDGLGVARMTLCGPAMLKGTSKSSLFKLPSLELPAAFCPSPVLSPGATHCPPPKRISFAGSLA